MVYEPIGIIHTPHREGKNSPIQPMYARKIAGRVEVFSEFAAGLANLDGFSHLILIYHLHQIHDSQLRVTPFMDTQKRGVFATRSPRRPNAIGISTVKLKYVQDGNIYFEDADMLDGTPLLDIKPHVPAFDSCTDVKIGWLQNRMKAESDG